MSDSSTISPVRPPNRLPGRPTTVYQDDPSGVRVRCQICGCEEAFVYRDPGAAVAEIVCPCCLFGDDCPPAV